MIQGFSRNRGFTSIELAIMILISGLLMAAGLRLYDTYLRDKNAHDSYDKLRVLDSSLSYYINLNGRLPCPSNPSIPVTDPNAGREIAASSCATLRNAATPVGTCLDGVCKVDGYADTEADTDTNVDPVLVGGVPFVAMRAGGASLQSAVDAWNYQFTYAVSGYLTNASTYRSSWGAIDVRTEPSATSPRTGTTLATLGGTSMLDPVGSSQYVIIAHGSNHLGAYSAEGKVTVPCSGTQDADNCDNNPVVQTQASFTAGLRVDSTATTSGTMCPGAVAGTRCTFDDLLVYNSYAMSSLWDFVGTSGDIHNLNPGFVGLGTSTPTQQLDVNGDIKATQLNATLLCDKASGAECWSPDLLAAPASTGNSLYCPDTATPGMADVVIGITNDASVPPKPKAVCGLAPKVQPSANQTCPPGQFVLRFNPTGGIVCGVP
ncbi:MAG: hypothetical protein EPN97_15425 [Alphaproteobacteria bacterium]|nr:MAG: hypothetical protein EPN97_15425 [Alphaproteobacteria bacterium]